MAEVLISTTIEISLEQVASLAACEIRLLWGFKKNLKSLKETLELISALVEDAEEKHVVKDHSAISLWLKSLEALACRAEHILDEVNYERLRSKVVEDPYWFKGKVSSFFSSHNQPYFLVKMVHKVDDLNTRFVKLCKKANKLGLQSRLGAIGAANATLHPSNNVSTLRETDSVLGQKVIGRETEASYIVDKLLNPSDEILTSIPIRGMGGLGKTTLAKLIYNDEKIDMYLKIWVGVPQNCDPVHIFRLILESLTKDSAAATLMGRDTIVQKIKEKIKGKKYLLVLDDVWSADRVLWDDILGCLRGISTVSGNWIIVTTREQDVAAIFSSGRDIPLDKLSSEDCLKIVKERALISEEQNQDFEAIRKNIRNLCQGLPLVASIIGGLLRTNSSKNWNSLLQKGISNMAGDEYSHVMHILRLSFDNLPSPSIKKCFAYCSLFAKASFMDKKQLILLWMAEGFIQPKPGHDDMEIGSECIKSLIGSSLFEEVLDYRGECKCVRMHDLVHDLAKSILNPVKDLKDLKEQDRHIVINFAEKGTEALPKMKMLGTLFGANGTINSMLLTSFKYLHVLKLSQLENDELPSSIRNLIHLRYLGLSDFRLETFPESTLELYNLQTLTIERFWSLKALPEGITKLINLRHLHCDSFVSLPPKIGRLTNLQTVMGRFKISEDNQFKELGFLKNLAGELIIGNLEYVSNKEEAQQAGLNRKPITKLSYRWHWERFREDVDYEAVLEGLEPHPNLQNLRIQNYKGTRFPSWFMNMVVCLDQNPISSHILDKLVFLAIDSCPRCKQLPALGQLPSLKYLHLMGLDSVSCIEPSFYGTFTHHVPAKKIFPALRAFFLSKMSNLTEWMGYQTTEDSTTEAVEIFPNLEQLRINYCEKLRHAPIHYFHRLKELTIKRTNVDFIIPVMEKDQNCHRFPNSERLPKRIFTSLQSLEIVEHSCVSELPEYLWEFRSLRKLEIRDCSNLKSLAIPMDFHGKAQQPLTSLQELAIVGCHGLNSFPHELINSCASLSKLAIGGFCDSVEIDWSILSSSISKLELDTWPNWVYLPYQLQHLTGLKELQLIRLKNIETLPDWFANLKSLESLYLDHLEKLCQLPSMADMRSLEHLSIRNCPLLEERCTPRSSPDSEWTKISHIPRVYIDGKLIDSYAYADAERRMSKCSRLRIRCF